ncbi:hypothetical protein ACKUUI_05995 [Mycobacterium seoulense]|uniref:hypothetical protein n=1 Tax=Mycobacterium seoulense TaxID=386911 RepID=UPI003CF50BFB
MSLGWWVYGWFAGFANFMVNVAAALALVGPALFFSNIVVKAVQDERARASVGPLLRRVNELLYDVFETADPAFRYLHALTPASPRELLEEPNFLTLAATLDRTLSELDAAILAGQLDWLIMGIHPLSVPQFGLVSKLVQQADRQYQMPLSVVDAVVMQDWGEVCGVDFVYQGAMHDTKVGLARIRAESASANPHTTGAHTSGYLRWVRGCLEHASAISRNLAAESPRALFVDAAGRRASRRQQARWITKRIAYGDAAGPRPPRL